MQSDLISLDEAIEMAPSIIGRPEPHGASGRYKHIPTIRPLQMLIGGYGYKIALAQEAGTRNPDKVGRQKHLIRLRAPMSEDESGANEVILLNAHDRSSSYKLLAGRFEFICANGLIAGDLFARKTVRHSGRDVIGKVVDSVHAIAATFGSLSELRAKMAAQELTDAQARSFAREALMMRFDKKQIERDRPDARELLAPRRAEDQGVSLWTVYNVVQENLIKGYHSARLGAVSKVRAIDKQISINQSLWNAAVTRLA